MSGNRVICTSPGVAQFAWEAALGWPQAVVICTYLDLYRADLALGHWRELPGNLQIHCASDFPDGEVDLVALPFAANGEAELTRELIQAGHDHLRLDGKMYATTDNRDDTWLRNQLAKVFSRLERHGSPVGTLYVGTKTEPLKRRRNFSCEFAFRDIGRLIHAVSRPGVFSHRSIDAGARQLLNEMQVNSGERILDIGCGSGVVALAAACRAVDVVVHAVDSNCRAVQCTRSGADLNGLTNLTTELNASGVYMGAGSFDLALANPPYYSSFRIARHFLSAGRDALRSGGKILVVTKRPDWYQQNMPELYAHVSVSKRKSYYVIEGVRP